MKQRVRRRRAATGQLLFFPVFDQRSSAGLVYHVIGWAAFVIDVGGVDWGSHTRQLTGHFVTFIATDLASGGTDRRRHRLRRARDHAHQIDAKGSSL